MLKISYKTNIYGKWIKVNSFDKISNNAIGIDCEYNNLTKLPELQHLTNLQEIYCSNNKLTSLPEWQHLTNLQTINCYNNCLTSLPEWQRLTNLQEINCSYNKLTSLPEWKHFTNLQKIYCSQNQLTSLPEWQHLINLQEFFCRFNQLTSLPEWQYLTNLQIIDCDSNNLTSLPEWQHLTNLQIIYCNYNQLTTLPEWKHLTNLQIIDCAYNKLTSLPVGWIRLQNLRNIKYYGNPIEYIPPNLRRIIQGQRTGQNIYQDTQSVHNHNIQLSLQKSIEYLIKDKPTISIPKMKSEITNECIVHELLLDYCNDKTIHSVLNVTFEEILNSIWSKIRISEYKNEIIKILNIEMLDSECKCFTGRLTRLVNCLNGFDENIKIEIDNNEQMSNISKILYNKYDNIEDYKRELRKEFEERGYSEEDIQIWSNIE
jgi:Leucine-rich repeat (LRR) protein